MDIDKIYELSLDRDDLAAVLLMVLDSIPKMEVVYKDEFIEGFIDVAPEDEIMLALANSIQVSDYMAREEIDRILKQDIYKLINGLYSEFDASKLYTLEFNIGSDQIYFKLEETK